MIGIESLDLYTFNKLDTKEYYLVIFLIRSKNYIRYINSNTKNLFKHYFLCIYLIDKLIHLSNIRIITSNLIYKYYIDKDELLIKQYISKFTYYYKKTQYFYNQQSYADTLNINEISIYNLYIINQMCQQDKNSLKYLITYLTL